MAKDEADTKASHKITYLLWAARLVSLLPGLAATGYMAIGESIHAARYDTGWEAPAGVAVMSLFFLVLPGLVAWKWHMIGGLWLLAESVLNILLIISSIVTRDPYAYFELDQSWVLRAILPFWITTLVGGCLHFAVSIVESRARRGSRGASSARP